VIKVVSTFRLRPDRPRADTDAHYLHHHVPLVAGLLADIPGAVGYVQNRVNKPVAFDFNRPEPRSVEPLFDWMVELWFESHEARQRMARHPGMEQVLADHPNFMQTATERCMEYYLVEENVALAPPGP
jgi:uncharacterized protein (TIGR02118 family)